MVRLRRVLVELGRCVAAHVLHASLYAVGLALEMGKVGILKLTLELIFEKRSGKFPELLQLMLFLVCKLCLVGTIVCSHLLSPVAQTRRSAGACPCSLSQ
jgi:hypothetical protein